MRPKPCFARQRRPWLTLTFWWVSWRDGEPMSWRTAWDVSRLVVEAWEIDT